MIAAQAVPAIAGFAPAPESRWRFEPVDILPGQSDRVPPTTDFSSNAAPQPAPLAGSSSLTLVDWLNPDYPTQSLRAGEEGSVILNVHVEKRGRAGEVRILRSSGSPKLDEAALAAARQWTFLQPRRNGVPESAWAEIELRFRLYRFELSRIGEPGAASDGSQPAPAVIEPSRDEAALRHLIEALNSAEAGDAVAGFRPQDAQQMRDVVRQWGRAQEIELQSGVENDTGLRWAHYTVRHERALVKWKVAFDRGGAIWNAKADLTRSKESSLVRDMSAGDR